MRIIESNEKMDSFSNLLYNCIVNCVEPHPRITVIGGVLSATSDTLWDSVRVPIEIDLETNLK